MRVSSQIASAAMTVLKLTLVAGQFRHGLGRGDSLKVKLPAAPAVQIGRATLSIEVRDGTVPGVPSSASTASGSTADRTVPITQVQAALDRVFGQSFSLVQSTGEVTLRVLVTHYTPGESRIDQISQKVRVPAPPNPDGSPVIDAQTGQSMTVEKAYIVEQWTAKGDLAVRAEVIDSTGVLIDTFAPQATVKGSATVSVDGQDRVDRTQIPNSDQVGAKLVADLAAQFAPRYSPVSADLEIPLAVDEGLRPGNKIAQAGDFAAAAQSWKDASLRKGEDEGDRLHNLGALYEAQGYAALLKQSRIDDAEGFFVRAAEQYAAAGDSDPKEKYITRSADRARKGLALVEVYKQLEKKRQQALAAKIAPSNPAMVGQAQPVQTATTPHQSYTITQDNNALNTAVAVGAASTVNPVTITSPQVPGGNTLSPQPHPAPVSIDPAIREAMEAALNDPRADSTEETTFRQLVRLRVRTIEGAVTDEARQQLESAGPMAYSLTALQSKRIVHQEARGWSAMQPKIAIYRDSFAAFAADGKIVASERQALQTLAKNLGIPEADVRIIESTQTVKE